jgi:hypothetical protein
VLLVPELELALVLLWMLLASAFANSNAVSPRSWAGFVASSRWPRVLLNSGWLDSTSLQMEDSSGDDGHVASRGHDKQGK